MALPAIFPAVSSAAKTLLRPVDHLAVVHAVGHPSVLLSAYDIARARGSDSRALQQLAGDIAGAGGVVALDSGGYESYWLRDPSWTFDEYMSVVRDTPAHLVFSFDAGNAVEVDGPTPRDIAELVSSVAPALGSSVVVPIVHCNTTATLAESLSEVLALTKATHVAVAERELGQGVVEGCRAIRDLRAGLRGSGFSPHLHLLGAGNPLSIVCYTAAGADTFDGLDWCQTVANFDTATLHHSRHLDLFAHQSEYGQSSDLAYDVRLLAHNLSFFRQWQERLVAARAAGRLADEIRAWVPVIADQIIALTWQRP